MTDKSLKIYVACLASYNSGRVHGVWLDATQDLKKIRAKIRRMLNESPIQNASDWAIHGEEGFGDLELSETENLETIQQIVHFIQKHGELGRYLLAQHKGDTDYSQKMLDEYYVGCFETLADYALETMRHEVPDHLHFHIDWQKVGEDMTFTGDVDVFEENENTLHIFSY